MGQRSQILLDMPPVFYKENNPNNRPRRLLAYHCQWLYGASFILYLERLLKGLVSLKELTKNLDYKRVDDSYAEEAIKYANHSCIELMTRTHNLHELHSVNEEERSMNKRLKEAEDVESFLDKCFDNNNGYIYIRVKENGDVSFGIVNGFEDGPNLISMLPLEYLHQFYDDKELVQGGYWETLRAIEYIEGHEYTDVFAELEELKNGL